MDEYIRMYVQGFLLEISIHFFQQYSCITRISSINLLQSKPPQA